MRDEPLNRLRNSAPPLCHRHCRDERTRRWSLRHWSGRDTIDRAIIVPERNIDNYYKRHNFEKQPALWCNCVRLKDKPIKINRHWIRMGG